MKHLFVIAAIVLLGAGPARAGEEWGIEYEKVVRFEAKVVDILCELSGDCPAKCGAGKRQLGLLKDDGRLIMVAKNMDLFAGATADLIGFCGQRIVADGLLIENPKAPMMVLQFKRLAPDGKWSRANWFAKQWAKANPGLDGGQWFRHDAAIKAELARSGIYGIPGMKREAE